MYQSMDGEAGDTSGLVSSGAFGEDNIRRGFIRKVYCILTFQLALTMGVMGIFSLMQSKHTRLRTYGYFGLHSFYPLDS